MCLTIGIIIILLYFIHRPNMSFKSQLFGTWFYFRHQVTKLSKSDYNSHRNNLLKKATNNFPFDFVHIFFFFQTAAFHQLVQLPSLGDT
jgi:hypothetical protein